MRAKIKKHINIMCEMTVLKNQGKTMAKNGTPKGQAVTEQQALTAVGRVYCPNGNGYVHAQVHSKRDNHHIHKKALNRTDSVISRTGERACQRIFLTICVYITFFELGLVGSVMGPTMVHMQYCLNTDITGMALTIVYQRIGCVIGVVLCGVLFDRLNQELQFAAACLIEGVAVACAPWSPNIYVFYALMSTQSLAHGYINTGLQSFLLSLWEGRRYKEPLMQACPALWSIGAALCPFIIRPFLVNIPEQHELQNMTAFSAVSDPNIDSTTATLSNATASGANASVLASKIEQVRYPYMIVGVGFAALCFLYIIAYMMLGPECDRKVLRTKKRQRRKSGDVRAFRVPLLVMLFLFFAFHAWYEGIFSGLLTAFVIEGLEWPVATGPLIMFVFYSAHALGRLLGIPISAFVSSTKMVFGNVAMTTVAFAIMMFVPQSSAVLMWAATGLAGFAMSTTYASMVLWASQYITITGAAGAVFLVGSNAGGMSGGALIGWLFQSQTYMWLIYMAFLACLAHIALVGSMYVFGRCHDRQAKKNLIQSQANTIYFNGDLPTNCRVSQV